jgi:ubiquinone/menaquinone biosynthesis C-methylase UbiE
MTEHLAGRFRHVHGVDVSGEMVTRAQQRLAHAQNVTLTETSGAEVTHVPDGSIDFAFSFIVFQHVPFRDAIVSTLCDVHRTLRPGGLFKFQVQGSRDPGFLAAERTTWFGVSFAEDELEALARELGFEPIATIGAGTQYFWSWWRRP